MLRLWRWASVNRSASPAGTEQSRRSDYVTTLFAVLGEMNVVRRVRSVTGGRSVSMRGERNRASVAHAASQRARSLAHGRAEGVGVAGLVSACDRNLPCDFITQTSATF